MHGARRALSHNLSETRPRGRQFCRRPPMTCCAPVFRRCVWGGVAARCQSAATGTFVSGPLTVSANLARWHALCDAFGVLTDDAARDQEFGRVLSSWRSIGRHYHTAAHLAACLFELDRVRELARRPAEVEWALWYHDAIYRPWRRDNEVRSATWAARVLATDAATSAARVFEAIEATRHIAPDSSNSNSVGDVSLVLDIDLAILGAPEPVYDVFEQQIRREYWFVPRLKYLAARRAILSRLLSRPRIYYFEYFRDRYETQARHNLQRIMILR